MSRIGRSALRYRGIKDKFIGKTLRAHSAFELIDREDRDDPSSRRVSNGWVHRGDGYEVINITNDGFYVIRTSDSREGIIDSGQVRWDYR